MNSLCIDTEKEAEELAKSHEECNSKFREIEERSLIQWCSENFQHSGFKI